MQGVVFPSCSNDLCVSNSVTLLETLYRHSTSVHLQLQQSTGMQQYLLAACVHEAGEPPQALPESSVVR